MARTVSQVSFSLGLKSIMRFSRALMKFKTGVESRRSEFSFVWPSLGIFMIVLQSAVVVNVQWGQLLNHVQLVHGGH